jgi:hypothetical protein
MGIWRIEYLEEENKQIDYLTKTFSQFLINSKETNIVKKLTSPKIIMLSYKPDKLVFYVDLVKIKSNPIFDFKMIENMIIIIGRKNNNGSAVSLEYLHGIIKDSKDSLNSENKGFSNMSLNEHQNKNKLNLESKYLELKNKSVHSINNDSDNNSNKNSKKTNGESLNNNNKRLFLPNKRLTINSSSEKDGDRYREKDRNRNRDRDNSSKLKQ